MSWLSLNFFILVLAIVAVGGVGWVLWQDAGGSPAGFSQLLTQHTVTAQVTPEPTSDALRPVVTITPELANQEAELETQLVKPLRAFYATKPERLGTITIAASGNDQHTAQVTYEVITSTGPTTHTFYYDRTGKDHKGAYPTWEPSLLDKTQ